MTKKITIDDLAQLIENRTKHIEEKMATKEDIEGLAVMVQQNMASKEFVREVVGAVLDVVKNIDERMGDIKASTASALEQANLELRVDAMERDLKKIAQFIAVCS
jgi:Asp-tRNA(Asn)/Glu-tRNA(Gln) amidotransferase B subunit